MLCYLHWVAVPVLNTHPLTGHSVTTEAAHCIDRDPNAHQIMLNTLHYCPDSQLPEPFLVLLCIVFVRGKQSAAECFIVVQVWEKSIMYFRNPFTHNVDYRSLYLSTISMAIGTGYGSFVNGGGSRSVGLTEMCWLLFQ